MQAMLFRIGDGRSVNGLQLQPNPLIHITTLAVLGLFLEGVVEQAGRGFSGPEIVVLDGNGFCKCIQARKEKGLLLPQAFRGSPLQPDHSSSGS